MQSMKSFWTLALCMTVSALTGTVLAEETADQTQVEAVVEVVAEGAAEAATEAEAAVEAVTEAADDVATEVVEAPADEAVSEPELATTEAEPPVIAGQLPATASHEDISYSIGYTIGVDMMQRGGDFDTDQVIEGMRAALDQSEPRLTPDQISQSLFSFQMQMQQQMMQVAQGSLVRGQAYLDENAQKEGVVVTESGLQYRVIQSGDGATPTVDDIVAARYRGTLVDGTEFDSSPEGDTVSFPVARVIPGWVEALQMMKVGDKWELTVPSDLAYGERGSQQGTIGPNETLVFEIELVAIESAPEQPVAP